MATGHDITRITSPAELADKGTVEARLAADGVMTLALDGTQLAAGKCKGPLDRQPQEAFCVGHDDVRPVDAYDGKPLFQGAIRNLRLSTDAQSPKQ